MVNKVLVCDSPATLLDSNSFSWYDALEEGDPTKGISLRVSVEGEDISRRSVSWFRTSPDQIHGKLRVNVEQECIYDSDSDVHSDSDYEYITCEGEPVDKEVVMRYLKQVEESEGFDIPDFPGFIEGVTDIITYQHPIEDREEFSEEYNKIMDMATMSIAAYNKQNGTKYKVAEIEKVNCSIPSRITTYYLTFSVVDVKKSESEKGFMGSLLSNQLVKILAGVQTASVVDVKESENKKGFMGSLISNQLVKIVAAVQTVALTLCPLLMLKIALGGPWNEAKRNLLKKSLKLKSSPHLKASEHELLDGNTRRTTFQAVVWDDRVTIDREVELCRKIAV